LYYAFSVYHNHMNFPRSRGITTQSSQNPNFFLIWKLSDCREVNDSVDVEFVGGGGGGGGRRAGSRRRTYK
jgi:hypothetical protein